MEEDNQQNQNQQQQQRRKVHTHEEVQAYKAKKQEEEKKARELERIQKLIVCVCEENIPDFQNQINKLIDQLQIYVERKVEDIDEKIINVFSQSVALIDNKSAIYALVFGKLIVHETDFSMIQLEIWKKVHSALEKAIVEGNLNQISNITQFLSHAVIIGYYSESQFLLYLKKLQGMQSDFFTLVILQIFCFNLEQIKEGGQWNELFKDVQKYISSQQQVISQQLSILSFYQEKNKEKSEKMQNIFQVLVERINLKIENSDFGLSGFYNPISDLFSEQIKENQEDFQKFQEIIKDIKFQDIVLKNDKQILQVYKKLHRKNFDFTKNSPKKEEVKGGIDVEGEDKEINLKEEENNEIKSKFDSSLERVLLQLYQQQLIETYQDNKKLLNKRLQNFCNHQFKFLEEIMQRTIIENLLDLSLILPSPQFKESIYTSILISFAQKTEFGKQYVSEYLENLLNNNENISNIDIEIVQRLSKQYALFLANTNLSLDWEIFSKYTEEQEEFNIQQYFLKLLFKELFYYQTANKMCQNIPEGLQQFFPSYKQKTDLIKLENNEKEQFQFCLEKLNAKTQSEPMIEFLESYKDEEDKQETFKSLFPYFLEALFQKMCPTQTHLNILFNRYKPLFVKAQELLGKEKFGEIVGERILFFWQLSDFHMIKYLNKFYQNELLDSQQIVTSIINKIEEVSSEVEAEETQIRYFNVLKSINTDNQIEIAQKLLDIISENNDESIQEFTILEKLFRQFLRSNYGKLVEQDEGKQILEKSDSDLYLRLQNYFK